MADERVRVIMSRAEPGGRPLTKNERIEICHVLRGIDDVMLGAVRAYEPAHGMHTVTDRQHNAQVDSLIRRLEFLRIGPGEVLVSEPEGGPDG